MKSYRVVVIELGAEGASDAVTTREVFSQVLPEADFNLRGVINAVNSKPRVRNRKQTLVAPVKPVPMGPLFSEPFKEAAK
jgi:hypothetical protein